MTYIDPRIDPQFIPPQVGGMTFKPNVRRPKTRSGAPSATPSSTLSRAKRGKLASGYTSTILSLLGMPQPRALAPRRGPAPQALTQVDGPGWKPPASPLGGDRILADSARETQALASMPGYQPSKRLRPTNLPSSMFASQ